MECCRRMIKLDLESNDKWSNDAQNLLVSCVLRKRMIGLFCDKEYIQTNKTV